MMFVDEATIYVKGGAGGNGMSSFRHEKYVAKGGPDGGDGGNGGDVIVRPDHNVNTLSEFRYSKTIAAQDGEGGKKQKAHGANGSDAEIKVPFGTLIYADDQVLADLTAGDEQVVIARGGRGGYGNAHFTSSRRQAPRMAELGESGEEKEIRLELKTVADVGLVGLPNAGKSTLLSVISKARPKIADYPFTTLTPNLGVVDAFDTSLIFADIPGLIAGASQGKGLGMEFLRHIERTKVLLHLVDGLSDTVAEDYQTIQHELAHYEVDLTDKEQLVALTKTDTIEEDILQEKRQALEDAGVPSEMLFTISSVAHKGLEELLAALLSRVEAFRLAEAEKPEPEEDVPTITLADDPSAWWVENEQGTLVVHGEQIGKFAERTDFHDGEAMQRLRDILKKRGIDRELSRQGVEVGTSVRVGGKTFTW